MPPEIIQFKTDLAALSTEDRADLSRAFSQALESLTKTTAAKTPMMAMTIKSSIRVNPALTLDLRQKCLGFSCVSLLRFLFIFFRI